MLIVEDPTVTVKYRTTIKTLFIYFVVCLSVIMDSLIMFIYIHVLSFTN